MEQLIWLACITRLAGLVRDVAALLAGTTSLRLKMPAWEWRRHQPGHE